MAWMFGSISSSFEGFVSMFQFVEMVWPIQVVLHQMKYILHTQKCNKRALRYLYNVLIMPLQLKKGHKFTKRDIFTRWMLRPGWNEWTQTVVCSDGEITVCTRTGERIAASSTLLDTKFNVVQAEGTTAGLTKASLPDTQCSFTQSNLHSQSERYNQDPLVQAEQVPNTMASSANGKVREREVEGSSSHHDILCPPTKKAKNLFTGHQSGFMPLEDRKATEFDNTKGFESVSSFNQFFRLLHGSNADCPCSRKLSFGINTKEQSSEGTLKLDGTNADCPCSRKLSSGIDTKKQTKANDSVSFKRKGTLNNESGDNSRYKMEGSFSQRRPSRLVNSSNYELPGNTLSRVNSTTAPEVCSRRGDKLKLANIAHEDFILKEALLAEDKHKRLAEFSVGGPPMDKRQKLHWNCVLEEMEWLAHDFSQERVWKVTAAAQVCHWVASAVRCRFNEQLLCQKQRKVASTMSKAIIKFWHSAKETSEHMEDQKSFQCTVHEYAVRFLKQNNLFCFPLHMGTPITPVSDLSISEIPCEVQGLEESLFYTASPSPMERYKKLAESDWPELKITDRNMHQEKAEASMFGIKAEFQSQENAYEKNKEEKDRHNRPGAFRVCKSLRTSLKGRKTNTTGSKEVTSGLSYKQHREHNLKDQSSALMERKPSNILGIVPVPTKRVRSDSRRPVYCPSSHKASGGVQMEKKSDLPSIDASSSQDKQNTWLPSEDQALLVLVHKLGPNWELVSDAINSTFLAKDSAWNVSRCLEDTIEVDSLKSHFQKIILTGKQQKAARSQISYLGQKQTVPVYHSQFLSVARVNSIRSPLTPLYLCDSTTSAPEASSLSYRECLASGLKLSNKVSVFPVSGANKDLVLSPSAA
ncbi:Chromatin modification-related protein eaf1 b [Thalictrum thalictroides]|uniref:Chromatin modification-related protein eaf1 b n=1 Tax=Thalictrum thalictroides TaxID=46969 RepID=A0A7J6VEC1_THATH|nr:Chromatin modification-related protein eaf1 b [Thalictrum thalictroides]